MLNEQMKKIIRNDQLTRMVMSGPIDEWDIEPVVEVDVKALKPPIQPACRKWQPLSYRNLKALAIAIAILAATYIMSIVHQIKALRLIKFPRFDTSSRLLHLRRFLELKT